MPLLDVELSKIEEGVNHYQFSVAPEELGLEEEGAVYRQNVGVEVKITRTGKTLTVKGVVTTSIERTCARCLEPFEEELVADFFEAVQVEDESVRVLDDQYDGDPGFLGTSPGLLIIDPLVRESVLVSSPMKPVCKADCRGLCPVCGADRNKIDCSCVIETIKPTWEALRGLTDDLKKKE